MKRERESEIERKKRWKRKMKNEQRNDSERRITNLQRTHSSSIDPKWTLMKIFVIEFKIIRFLSNDSNWGSIVSGEPNYIEISSNMNKVFFFLLNDELEFIVNRTLFCMFYNVFFF